MADASGYTQHQDMKETNKLLALLVEAVSGVHQELVAERKRKEKESRNRAYALKMRGPG